MYLDCGAEDSSEAVFLLDLLPARTSDCPSLSIISFHVGLGTLEAHLICLKGEETWAKTEIAEDISARHPTIFRFYQIRADYSCDKRRRLIALIKMGEKKHKVKLTALIGNYGPLSKSSKAIIQSPRSKVQRKPFGAETRLAISLDARKKRAMKATYSSKVEIYIASQVLRYSRRYIYRDSKYTRRPWNRLVFVLWSESCLSLSSYLFGICLLNSIC